MIPWQKYHIIVTCHPHQKCQNTKRKINRLKLESKIKTQQRILIELVFSIDAAALTQGTTHIYGALKVVDI